MKRIISFLLVLIMLFSLCACKDPVDPDSTTTPTTAPTDPTQPTVQRQALQPLLDKRKRPALKERDEMLATLANEVYGAIPAAPTDIKFTVKKDVVNNYAAGKANMNEITMECTVNGKPFSFSFRAAIPKSEEKVPFFVFIGFASGESRFAPIEEIIDNGYAILFFHYEHVATDDGDFTKGLAANLFPDGVRADNDPGKISMWAWGASRLMDYAETISDKLDLSRAVVCGHSRTAKAALWAGANDTRFQYVYSNNSGCSGAALSYLKGGEEISRITNVFPYWFCKNYQKYAYKEKTMPFDQHWLIASIAPRKVLVGSASWDENADPLAEQLGCLAAAPAFPNGFVCDVVAQVGEEYYEGDIGYHLREGAHYFSREDWQKLIKFVNMKSAQTK